MIVYMAALLRVFLVKYEIQHFNAKWSIDLGF